MGKYIGIRHEDKYIMERRAPLTPRHVKFLVKHSGLDVVVQKSAQRAFKEKEYINAGAEIATHLDKCSVIFGVKEMPATFFEEDKTYVFFSHLVKGQPYNMPMLKQMMERKCNLIDYERIVDEQNRRLIFFGRYAGLAGMINSLWSLGQRMKYYGHESKLLRLKQAHQYESLQEAKDEISAIGQLIAEQGVTEKIRPVVFGFTGYGNVSNGAQEILGLLPIKEISPKKLLNLKNRKHLPNNIIYKVVFKEEHLVKPINPDEHFDLQDYYSHPEKYKSQFEQYIPHLTVLMNCMYWDPRYPRIVTKDYLEKLYAKGTPKLTVIGDITCDPDGSIECTHKGTHIEDPVFVYNPFTRQPSMGFGGEGLLVMAVDILPSELPRDSSEGFGDALLHFIKPIAMADYDLPFEDIDLPRAIKKALILHKGKLTHEYEYLQKHLQ